MTRKTYRTSNGCRWQMENSDALVVADECAIFVAQIRGASMTITAKIRRQGGATVFSIPPALLKMLGVEVGSELTLVVSNGALVATPTRAKKRYTLAELLDGADEMSELNKQAAAWNVSPPVGNEAS